jgi:hypothetical protein
MRTRISRRVAAAAALVLALSSLLACGTPAGRTTSLQVPRLSTTAGAPLFGTLDTISSDAQTEVSDGLRAAMVELSWSAYEPSQGQFDADYLQGIASQVVALHAAGLAVTLGLGLHFTPSWVTGLTDGVYVDEHGDSSSEADLVFSQNVRNAVASYLQHVAAGLDLAAVSDVRLTSGGDEEMLYPTGGSYWAFSAGAQNGTDMATGLAPNPEPGWSPGSASYPGHANLTAAQIAGWLSWYVEALDEVTGWQISALRGDGYGGGFQLVTPGSGVRPDGVSDLVADDLPDSVAGVGAVWATYYANLPTTAGVQAYVSSVADGSGDDDLCAAGDGSLPVASPVADDWSATRWITRLAAAAGVPVGGENPGLTSSNASHYQDPSSSGLMAVAIAQAASCHFSDFFWAHDAQLHDGTIALSTYADDIADTDRALTALHTSSRLQLPRLWSGRPAT